MADNDAKILKALEDLLAGQTKIEKTVTALQADVTTLKQDVTTLKQHVESVELKVEASHEFNKKAHTELVSMIADSNDIHSHEQKKLEQRIERIEKHLGLSPLK